MARKWKIWVEPKGMSQVMKSNEVVSALKEIGDGVTSRAGEGYEAEVMVKSNRAVCHVRPVTPKAYYSNKKNNTLLKALGG